MCEAPVMQLDEHALDRGVDPRIGTVRDRFGAQGKDIGEGGVGGDAEPIRRDRLAQRSGYAEPIERQDRPLARLNPENAARIAAVGRSEEHTSELQSLMRISYAVFCLKKKKKT